MSKLSLEEFGEKVGGIMPFISREFLRHQNEEFYKTKITMPQFIVLELLSRYDESKMTDLAKKLYVTTAAVTGIVERLVRDRYVGRVMDPGDRRVIKIKLTQKGLSLVRKINDNKKSLVVKIFGVVSQKEREDYLKILEHIRDHLIEQEKLEG